MTQADFEVLKKRKTTVNNGGSSLTKHASKIFSPFRVIGNVSNGTPFAVGTLGTTFYIVTSVGKSFQIYDANNLHLLFLSEGETESLITCFATHHHYVFAGFGSKVGVYKRGKLEFLIELEEAHSGETVEKITLFGDFVVISTRESSNIYVYKKEKTDFEPTSNKTSISYQLYTTLRNITDSVSKNAIIDIIHLPTYLNKIVVVTQRNVVLYNVRTGKNLYSSEEFATEITSVVVAPALDIIALGSANGEVILYNVKKGRKLRTIKPHSVVRITSLSFRTDNLPHLAIGYANGDLVFYDLNRRSRVHVLTSVHKEINGGIAKAEFLNGQPIIITTGGDNQLKEFVFDPPLTENNNRDKENDDEMGDVVQPPRLLRSRGGHSKPPTKIQFADNEAHFILSASSDSSLWGFSLRKDAQAQEFSQRAANKGKKSKVYSKLPTVIDMSIELARAGEWDNLVTAHENSSVARTWNSKTKRLGSHLLKTGDDGFVTAVHLSTCGNFAFIGSSKGSITVYNMQSGTLRKKFNLHKQSITGICVDSMNRKMVSVGLDGIVGFYDFAKSKFLGKLQLESPITSLKYHRGSDLFALALDDLSIVVIDSESQKIVRQMFGHNNRITALEFSPDGRWIISASLDATIRTWDLPTGTCIDGVRVDSVVTNLCFSSNGEYLATAHVKGNGISIWTNRAQFKAVSTRQIDESEFQKIMLPNSTITGGVSMLEGALGENESEEAADDQYFGTYQSLAQIDEDLVTLSLGPRSKMNTLLHLETIKKRSKPTEAPKKPEKLPFFLQLTGSAVGDEASSREGALNQSAETAANIAETKKKETEATENLNKFKPTGRLGFESKFTNLLRESARKQDYTEFLELLISMSPAAIDLEIRSLNSFEPFEEINWFIEALTAGFESNTNFDLLEAFMNMLLKVHGDVIHSHSEAISPSLNEWNKVHKKKEENLDDLVKFCSSVVNFVNTSM